LNGTCCVSNLECKLFGISSYTYVENSKAYSSIVEWKYTIGAAACSNYRKEFNLEKLYLINKPAHIVGGLFVFVSKIGSHMYEHV